MNSRQRRRLRRRINADPELHGLFVTRAVAHVLAALTAVLVAVLIGMRAPLAPELLGTLCFGVAEVTALLVRHAFSTRLRIRQAEWMAQAPTVFIRQDMVDALDLPEQMAEPEPPTRAQAYHEHVVVPTMREMADRITAQLHATDRLPPDVTMRWGRTSDPEGFSGDITPEESDDDRR